MTEQEIKQQEGLELEQLESWTDLEKELASLIADESSGLGDLAHFQKHLSQENNEKKLDDENLEWLKEDLQDGKLVSFEAGERDGKVFGWENIGNDILPTVTPNGDCIIPVNFWFNNQRRTKLLVLHVKDEEDKNSYHLSSSDNTYEIEISKEKFVYQLIQNKEGFEMKIVS